MRQHAGDLAVRVVMTASGLVITQTALSMPSATPRPVFGAVMFLGATLIVKGVSR